MSDALKPALYLPIEIKAREFNAKLLLAAFAAKKGFRVYLGTKAALDQLFKSPHFEQGGIYFYKSGQLRDRLNIVKDAVDSLVVLDEEMGVAVRNPAVYYESRISNHELIDRYFVLSDKHRRLVEAVRPAMSSRVKVLGWPRVDLWRSELKSFYAADVSKLKSLHANFFLFSSDFGFITAARVAEEKSRFRRNGESENVVAGLSKKWEGLLLEYQAFVETLRLLDQHESCPKIIVRPHPAEDHQQWFKDLKGLRNISAIYEGEITPWLLSSQGLIHRGCTTAVQAYISKTPAFFWLGDEADYDVTMLPYQVSTPVNSIVALLEALNAVQQGSYAAPSEPEILSDEIHLADKLAAELIAEELSMLTVRPCRPYHAPFWHSVKIRMLDELRMLKMKAGIGVTVRKRERYFRKLTGGIGRDEVLTLIGRFNQRAPFKVKQVAKDLVQIDM